MNRKLPVCFLVASLLLTSCLTERQVQILEIGNFSADKIGKETVISMELLVDNPNNWGCTVEATEAELLLDDRKIGSVQLKHSFRLRADTSIRIPCSMTSSMTELSRLLPAGISLLFGNTPVIATTKGTVTVRKLIFRKRYPFELKQKLDKKFLKELF